MKQWLRDKEGQERTVVSERGSLGEREQTASPATAPLSGLDSASRAHTGREAKAVSEETLAEECQIL